MPKPEWLKKQEQKKFKPKHAACYQCEYFRGGIGKNVKHKGKEWTISFPCKKHPDVWNTKFSYACSDWILSQDLDYD